MRECTKIFHPFSSTLILAGIKVEAVHVKEFMTVLGALVSHLGAHGACFTMDVNLEGAMETRSGSSS